MRAYRIEAGDDPQVLESIGLIDKPANGMLSKKFDYSLGDFPDHKYYRVVQVSMDHSWINSETISYNPASDTDAMTALKQ